MITKNIEDILIDFPFVMRGGIAASMEFASHLFFKGSIGHYSMDEMDFFNDIAEIGGSNYLYESRHPYYKVSDLTPMSFIAAINCSRYSYIIAFHKEELALLFKLKQC